MYFTLLESAKAKLALKVGVNFEHYELNKNINLKKPAESNRSTGFCFIQKFRYLVFYELYHSTVFILCNFEDIHSAFERRNIYCFFTKLIFF